MVIAPRHATLIDMTCEQAATRGSHPAFTFLGDGDDETERLTYAEVERNAKAIAARLVSEKLAGERVVLLFPPGLEYITAFLGCVFAGAIAVPAYPPHPARLQRTLPRLRAIVDDAKAAAFLTTPEIGAAAGVLGDLAPELASKPWIVSRDVDASAADSWKRPDTRTESVAFIQYTSGSTGVPKGVVLTHGNLLHNQELIRTAFDNGSDLVGVGWLPLYHDMGLIGNVLNTIYVGGRIVLMSPLHFLESPVRWLRAISKFRGTVSGGPNFAFDLCARRVTEEQRETLDLSSWRVAFCGAEPIRHDTLGRFVEVFGSRGFRSEAILACYGLAESSLIVTGSLSTQGPTILAVDSARLANDGVAVAADGGGRSTTFVGCGVVAGDQDVRIVDRTNGRALGPGRVGEIWVSGGSVARAYWNNDDATEATFGATLEEAAGRRYLRTGDLGYFTEGHELVVTGRLKDLIILRGRNYYPQDVERAAERAHEALRPGSGAAFGVDIDGETVLVVVQEYDPRRSKNTSGADELAAAIDAIRGAVTESQEIVVHRVVLVAPGQIPKTSSGKIMRSATERALREGSLEITRESTLDSSETSPPRIASVSPIAEQAPTEGEIHAFLVEWFDADKLTAVDSSKTFDLLGLDSLGAVKLASALSTWLGKKVSPTLFWDYPTIDALAKHFGAPQ
jgi:acyl-CoA synthetase (AMP-forming)/AMP-acid ligase II/acyl carrier protein